MNIRRPSAGAWRWRRLRRGISRDLSPSNAQCPRFCFYMNEVVAVVNIFFASGNNEERCPVNIFYIGLTPIVL